MEHKFEEWRAIPGWPYEASSQGRIRRSAGGRGARAGHVLNPKTHKHGYMCVDLSQDNNVHRFQIGHLVLLAFVGHAPEAGLEALHGDGDPSRNVPENMRWGTRVTNMDDARRHGTLAQGERHGIAKLTDNAVREMRVLRSSGMTFKALGEKFRVSPSNAYEACRGKQWAHVF